LKWVTCITVLVAGVALHYASLKEFPVHKQGGILVTGASSGIGRDVAIALAERGYVVFAGVRNEQDYGSVKKENIQKLKPVIIDVTKQETVDSCFKTIVKELGRLPFVALVNNAGIAKTYPIEFMSLDDTKWSFEVNYFGMIRVTQKFLPLLRKAGQGARIVQISSVAGLVAAHGGNPYSSTKFAVESLSDSLRREVFPFGISVSCINPGFIQTKILGDYSKHRAAAPPEHIKLYPHILNEHNMAREARAMKEAPTTKVTNEAIIHAISDPYPRLHYILGTADGMPLWLMMKFHWLLPGRIFDAMMLSQS